MPEVAVTASHETKLSDRDFKKFEKEIADDKPNKKLKSAAKKYQEAKRAKKLAEAPKAKKSKAPARITPAIVGSLKLMSIHDKELLAAIKGKKNSKSMVGIAKLFATTVQAAKRAVMRLAERNTHLKLRIEMRREGDRGPLSQCYFVEA